MKNLLIETCPQTPEGRQSAQMRRQRERMALWLIGTLATLRPHWSPEDASTGAIARLADRWDSIEITEDDLAALRDWPGLPLTLPGLLTDLDQHLADCWADCLEIG